MHAGRPARVSLPLLLLSASLTAAGPQVPLVEAVKHADAATIATLIEQRVDVNATDSDDMTALHWAVRLADLEAADRLIRGGADVKAATRFGITPLSLAALNGSTPMIEKLLDAGADPNTTPPEGETVLMTAARTGKVSAVKALLARGAEVNARERWRGQTGLMWAIVEGHTATVEALIDHNADLNARSNGGWTPFLLAVREGRLDIVRLLLDLGADANEPLRPKGQGGTTLGLADVVRAADPAASAATSALVLAIINGHYELAVLLLDHGADPNVPDARGSALHAVAFMRRPGSGHPPPQTGNVDGLELARALLEHGAEPNVRIDWKEMRYDRIDGLVKRPPNISVGRNFTSLVGATPFYVAARGGDVALMRLLVAHGADPRQATVQNVTPLMAAAGLGFWDGESPGPNTGVPESEALGAVKLLVEWGNDINAVTDYGPIRLEGDGISLLRRYALNLDEYAGQLTALGDMRWNGSTALHGAALRGADSVIAWLVENGAKVDATNTIGWIPLMIAEGMFISNTVKDWPSSAALLRRLMIERGLTPSKSVRPEVRYAEEAAK